MPKYELHKIRERKVTILTENWRVHGEQAHEHTYGNKIEILVRLISTCIDGTQSKVKTENIYPQVFRLRIQRDALSPLLLKLTLECADRKA